MRYSEYIKKVAHSACVSQSDAKRVLDSANMIIQNTVESGEEVIISGVGKFGKKTRNARKGINPATKQPIEIPATEVVTFKVAKEFKDLINS